MARPDLTIVIIEILKPHLGEGPLGAATREMTPTEISIRAVKTAGCGGSRLGLWGWVLVFGAGRRYTRQ